MTFFKLCPYTPVYIIGYKTIRPVGGICVSHVYKSVLVFGYIFEIIPSIIIYNTYLNMENYVYYCYIL